MTVKTESSWLRWLSAPMRRRPQRPGQPLRFRPSFDRLEDRCTPAVDITAFNVSAGTLTFTGDRNGTTADTLLLSEITVDLGGGVTETRLAHNLVGGGGTGNYADATDVDAGAGVAHIVIGSGSAPQVTVALGTDGDSLTLDDSWTGTDAVSFDGGDGNDTLIGSNGTNTWSLTSASAGDLNGYLSFSNTEALQGGTDADTVVGENADRTWSLGDTNSYDDGSSTLTLQGMETLRGGTAVDTFLVVGGGILGTASGNLEGGDGNDVFVLSAGTYLDGTLDGQGGSDTLDLTNSSGAYVVVTAATANGYDGFEVTAGGFAGIDSVTATAGSGLAGADVASTWTLGATQSYQINSASNSLALSGFSSYQGGTDVDAFNVTANTTADLRGGAGNDTFAVADGATLTGVLDGEADTDTLDLSAQTGNLSVALTGSAADGFAGTDGVTSGFSNIDVITSGSGSDTLTGEDAAATWSLGASKTYADGTATLAFSSFETLQGGSDVDTFNVTASSAATLKGGAGADSFNLSNGVALSGTVDGQAGSDTLDLSAFTTARSVTLTSSGANGFTGTDGVTSGFSNVDVIASGSGSDTLTGENAAATWSLGASKTYADGTATLTFSSFETLQGGSAADTFNVTANTTATLKGGSGADSFNLGDGVALTGSVSGEAGSDTLSYAGYSTAVSVTLTGSDSAGLAGTGTGVSGGFTGVNTVAGGTGSDTLTGEDATSTWSLGSSKSYSDGSQSLAFSSFETLQGGSAADTFNVTANTTAALKGGSGADSFVISDGVALTGTVSGEAGSDTLNLSAFSTTLSVTLTGSGANGYAGTDGVTSGFSGVDVISSGSGSDTLTGEDAAATWALGASKTYNDGSGGLTFSGFETLQGGNNADTFNVTANTTATLKGGAGADTFSVSNGVTLTGTVNGEAGSDTLNLSAYTTARSVTLTGSATDGFAGTDGVTSGFSNIDAVTGGSGSDTLTGENVAATWALGASKTYADGTATLTFSSFEALQGGSDVDTFNVTANTTASLKGGSGDDSFNLNANGVSLTGSVDGGAGYDSLSYAGYTSTAVNVALAGSATDGFSGTATNVSGGFSNVDQAVGGGGSNDTLTGANTESDWTLDGATKFYSDGSAFLDFSAFETAQGNDNVDTFLLSSNTTINIKGGGSADVLAFGADGVYLSGTFNGEAGSDGLDYSSTTSAVSVNLAAMAGTGLAGFSNVEGMVGGSGSNTLTAGNVANTWTLNGSNSGSVSYGSTNFAFTGVGNLVGGGSTDTFSVQSGASFSAVNGGAGTDTVTFAAMASSVTVNITGNNAGTGTATGVSVGFTAVENVTGGSGDDTFRFANGATVSGLLNGGGGTDLLDYSLWTTAVRVNLAQGAALNVNGGGVSGVNGFENVTGGSGNDILIGDGGANALNGGSGNDVLSGLGGDDTLSGGLGLDILIGGDGADTMDGGAGDDLLIGNRTSYDSNVTQLNALMAEWGRTDATYATKIAHLNGTLAGGRNGTTTLKSGTVFDDGATDSLTGNGGLDWFVALSPSEVTDLNTGGSETRTNL